MVLNKEYTNSRILCPVCRLLFAKNYLLNHLKKQHTNIYGLPEWEGSRYQKNFENIKKEHKLKYNIDNNKEECQEADHVEPSQTAQ